MADGTITAQRRLLVSNSSDAAGRALADFVLDVILVSILGATAMQMGLLNALGSVAFMVAAVPVGYLVDRYTALRILRLGLTGKLLVLLFLTVLVTAGWLTIPLAMVLVTILGLFNLMGETSQVSAVPDLTDPEHRSAGITRLIARLTAADQALGIIVPAVAGLLFALLGAPMLMSACAALAALALVLACRIRPVAVPGPASAALSGSAQKTGDVFSGFRLLIRDRRLLALTLQSSLCNAGLAMGAAVEGILILRHLDLGQGWFGIISAVGAAGGLVGAMLGPKVAEVLPLPRITTITGLSQVILAAMVLAAYFCDTLPALVLLLSQALFWGIVVVIFNIANMSWVTNLVQPEYLGRLTSVRRMFTFGAVPAGSLTGGLLGSAFGLWAALLAWCLMSLLGTVGYLMVMPNQALKRRHLSPDPGEERV